MAIVVQSHGVSPGANSASVVITAPTSIAVGDLLVAVIGSKTTGTDPSLSGWTHLLTSTRGASFFTSVLYKIANSSDAAAGTFTFNVASGQNIGGMLRITGHDSINPMDTSQSSNNAAAATTQTTGTVTPTNSNSLVIFCPANGAADTYSAYSNVTNPLTWTEQFDLSRTTVLEVACATAPQASAGATGTIQTTCSGLTQYSSLAVVVQPAGSTPLTPSVNDSTTTSENIQLTLNPKLISVSDSTTTSEEIGIANDITIYSLAGTPTNNNAFLERSTNRGIARDSSGNLYAVYNALNLSTGFFSIRISRSTDGGATWSQQVIYNNASASSFCPRIAIDSQNVIHVIFEGTGSPINPTINNIAYVTGTWSSFNSAIFLTDATTKNFTPSIAIDEYDTKHIVWNGYNVSTPTVEQIRYLSIDSGQNVSAITEVTSDSVGNNFNPDVAVDQNNNLLATWYTDTANSPSGFSAIQIYVKNYNTNTWAQSNEQSTTHNLYVPSAVVDASNNYYVAFMNFGPTNSVDIWKYNGSSWALFKSFTFVASHTVFTDITMAFDAAGVMYVAFSEQGITSTAGQIRYNKNIGGTWGTEMVIGGSKFYQVRPNMVYSIWPKVRAQPGVPAHGALGMWGDSESVTSDQASANILGWEDLNLLFQTATVYTGPIFDATTTSESVTIKIPFDSANVFDATTTSENLAIVIPLLYLSVSDSTSLIDFPFYFDDTIYTSENISLQIITINSFNIFENAADSAAGSNGWVWGAKIIG